MNSKRWRARPPMIANGDADRAPPPLLNGAACGRRGRIDGFDGFRRGGFRARGASAAVLGKALGRLDLDLARVAVGVALPVDVVLVVVEPLVAERLASLAVDGINRLQPSQDRACGALTSNLDPDALDTGVVLEVQDSCRTRLPKWCRPSAVGAQVGQPDLDWLPWLTYRAVDSVAAAKARELEGPLDDRRRRSLRFISALTDLLRAPLPVALSPTHCLPPCSRVDCCRLGPRGSRGSRRRLAPGGRRR